MLQGELIAQGPFPGFICQAFFLILTHLHKIFVGRFKVCISLCHFFHLLLIAAAEEFHPCNNAVRMVVLFWNFGKFQYLKLQLFAVQISGCFIIEPDPSVTEIVFFKIGKIQDANLYTFLKFVIRFALLELAGKHFT